MPFDIDYGAAGQTINVDPDDDDDQWFDGHDNVASVVVGVETEPSAFVGLMQRVEDVQSAFEDDIPASRVLECVLFAMDEEHVVRSLSSSSDWELAEEWRKSTNDSGFRVSGKLD